MLLKSRLALILIPTWALFDYFDPNPMCCNSGTFPDIEQTPESSLSLDGIHGSACCTWFLLLRARPGHHTHGRRGPGPNADLYWRGV